MGPKVAILDDYQNVALVLADWGKGIPAAEVVSFTDHLDDEDRLVERLLSFDVIVAMRERTPLTRSLFTRLPNLRLLVTTGSVNASIDLAAANAAGITVCGTGGGVASAPAELTWGLILGLVRNIPVEDAMIRAGGWQSTLGTGLVDKTIGIVGLGRIGGQVADVARSFGMRVIAWSPNLTKDRAAFHGAEFISKPDLFSQSDIVTIHLVLSATTRGIIGEEELRKMRRTAYLVNTSRGPIVDENALVQALDAGWIAGAGLDVFEHEPLPIDHPLRRSLRTVLTPHIGFVTRESYQVFYAQALEDVQAFLRGQPMRILEPPASV